ncbi:MAG: TIGR00725 family protein [Caldisericaceae bacterium]
MMTKKIIRIGLIGQSDRPWEPAPKKIKMLAYQVGYLIGKEGWMLFNGGRDGVMESSAKGCHNANGITVGILPSLDSSEANKYVDIPITTGLGIGLRSELMIHTVDAVVMVGGKNGTLLELTSAYLNKKPIVILKGTGDFADSISSILFEGKFLDSRKNVEIQFADTPEQVIELLKKDLNI